MNWAWNVELVNVPAALAQRQKTANRRIDWGPLKLCHLDTSSTDHPVSRDWASGRTCLRPNEARIFIESGPPVDPIDKTSRRSKSFGHGTRTASVICGGEVPQADGGRLAIGVAPGLSLIPCRVVNWVVLHTALSLRRVALGIQHAIAKGCQVVSMSLGTPLWNDELNQAVFAIRRPATR